MSWLVSSNSSFKGNVACSKADHLNGLSKIDFQGSVGPNQLNQNHQLKDLNFVFQKRTPGNSDVQTI